jgi:hypothetical protein
MFVYLALKGWLRVRVWREEAFSRVLVAVENFSLGYVRVSGGVLPGLVSGSLPGREYGLCENVFGEVPWTTDW